MISGYKRLFTTALICITLALTCATAAGQSLVVATHDDLKPFSFRKGVSLQGFDIDLWEALSKEMGTTHKYLAKPFPALFETVQSGKADVAIASITITEKRKEVVDFSDPYFTSGLLLLVHSDNTTIHSVDDLEGHVVACKLGTISSDYAYSELMGSMISVFRNIDDAFDAVIFHKVDALLLDAPTLKYYEAHAGKGRAKTVGPIIEPQEYGIAVRKGSPLRESINAALKSLRENGTFDEIYEKWFGEIESKEEG